MGRKGTTFWWRNMRGFRERGRVGERERESARERGWRGREKR